MLTLHQVPKLVFGPGAIATAREDLAALGVQRPLVITSPSNCVHAETLHPNAHIDDTTRTEPTVTHFETLLATAREIKPDIIVGLGGGSPLDAAKLVAALAVSRQPLADAFGIGKLGLRRLPLFCIPTTAGTGSEVSPNAVLLDEAEQMKKAVISPYLVPDAAFIDPALMLTVPAHVTAATGLDALTHCIEGYANNFAHPLVDTWALDGIRLIAASLATAVREPGNLEARANVARGSLYGGFCLGPVNTAAVHALSYPLGSRYHIPHGHANAILLPHVFRFNIPAAPERYAAIALALGATRQSTTEATAIAGIERLWQLIEATGLEMRLSEILVDGLRIPESAIPSLAASGLTVTRLLKNNPRPMTQQDAESIYIAAFKAERRSTTEPPLLS